MRYLIAGIEASGYSLLMTTEQSPLTPRQETDDETWTEIETLTHRLIAMKPKIARVSPPFDKPPFDTALIATADIVSPQAHIFNEWPSSAELSPIEMSFGESSSWFKLLLRPKDPEGQPMNAQAQMKDRAITVVYSPDYRVAFGWRSGGDFAGINAASPVNSESVIITVLEALTSQSAGVLEYQETAAQSTDP